MALPSRRRALGAVVAAGALAATLTTGTAFAAPGGEKGKPANPGKQNEATIQLLSFNDFHGHLEATDGPISADPSMTPVGGSEYLASTLEKLRSKAGDDNSLTVAAGDLIGGSTFLSGLFHDEPAVESLNALGLDVSSVGNHEFDEGTTELLRMQNGGCHPKDGCYFPDAPYAGADFQWLAANVIKKSDGESLLPATSVKEVHGVKVGFIGMTLEATSTLVSPAGVASVEFMDEVETANRQAALLKEQGVKTIIVLLHEGGYQTGTYNECKGISGPIVDIATNLDPEIDAVVSGHTHQPYICNIPDPNGEPRLVTSAADYGRVVTETNLVVNTVSGNVKRDKVTATNHLVTRDARDADQTAILEKWKAIAAPIAARVVGSVAEDITGDSSGNRGIETPMADLVADSILWGTEGDKGGAQIAFMNVGGVRASFKYSPKYQEGPGEVTYAEAYDVAPFGNLLVTIDMTGAQIKEALEQQYQPVPARGSRPTLALGVSKGFTYEWDATQPQGSRVVAGSMALNGTPLDLTATYRVGTLNFLADGGDLFTAFTQGTNRLGGAEDLANLVSYLEAHPNLKAPEDRVTGL
ncbi:MAG TPA: bifunctional metallophosphatase/5'-nucleotidase [Actinomycetales bacterium]|nr:bifunctional metallophosphatase/5'-nucleotidase [Actinomycetales bacterium]